MRHAAAGRTLGRQCVERERHGRRCMASAVKPGRAGDVQRPPRLCTAPWTVPVGCDHSYKIEASQDASILSVPPPPILSHIWSVPSIAIRVSLITSQWMLIIGREPSRIVGCRHVGWGPLVVSWLCVVGKSVGTYLLFAYIAMSKRSNSCTAIVVAGFWDDNGQIDSQISSIVVAMGAFEKMSVDDPISPSQRTGCIGEKNSLLWDALRAEAHSDQATARSRSRMAREHV